MSIIDYVLAIKSKFDGKGFSELTSNLTKTQQNLIKIGTMTGPLLQGMLSFARNMGGQLLQASMDLGAYESRFYAITKSEQLANEELEWTFDLARKTATNVKTLTDAYSIFYATASKSLGQENTRLIMKDWAEIARVTHLSGDAFGRVMYAMRELSSKGAIYADDVKRQLGGAVPGAIKYAEQAANDLGITGSNWWDILQKKAKGNQKVVNEFMIAFTKRAHEGLASADALRNALDKTDATVTQLSNAWELFKLRLADTKAFKRIIKLLGDGIYLLDKLSQNEELVRQLLILFASTLITVSIPAIYSLYKALKDLFLMMKTNGGPILLIVWFCLELIMQITSSDLPKWLKGVLDILVVVIGVLASLLVSGRTIGGLLIQGGMFARMLFPTILGWIQGILSTLPVIWATIKGIFAAIFGGISIVTGGILILIGILVWFFVFADPEWRQSIFDFWANFFKNIGDWFANVWHSICEVFAGIWNWLTTLDQHPFLKKMLEILGGINSGALPKVATQDTTINKNQNTTTLDINVNGQNVTSSNSATVSQGLEQNKEGLWSKITSAIKPKK